MEAEPTEPKRKRSVPNGTVKVRTDNLDEKEEAPPPRRSLNEVRMVAQPVGNRPSGRDKKAVSRVRKRITGRRQDDSKGNGSDDEPLKYGDKPDPLYDDKLDDDDTNWVHERYLTHTKRSSDAVLNCPACFTVLCFDCQRHAYYPNQYRAMFVQNCKVMLSQTTRPVKGDNDPDAVYHEVHCSKCDLNIAVRDSDEVYHFFNVLPSENSGDQATKKARNLKKA